MGLENLIAQSRSLSVLTNALEIVRAQADEVAAIQYGLALLHGKLIELEQHFYSPEEGGAS